MRLKTSRLLDSGRIELTLDLTADDLKLLSKTFWRLGDRKDVSAADEIIGFREDFCDLRDFYLDDSFSQECKKEIRTIGE